MQSSHDQENAKLLGRCWLDPVLHKAVLSDPAAFGISDEMLIAFQQEDIGKLDTLTDEQIPLSLDSLTLDSFKDFMAGMCRLSC